MIAVLICATVTSIGGMTQTVRTENIPDGWVLVMNAECQSGYAWVPLPPDLARTYRGTSDQMRAK